jgi:hypothetical protein
MRRLVPLIAVAALAVFAIPATAAAEPVVSRTCNGTAICDTWFTAPVQLEWFYGGTVTSGCVDERFTRDTAGALRSCIVTDGAETASRSVTIRLDQTPPAVADAVPDRPPDHDGWYSHPVTFIPQGTDATSGILGCTSVSYAGPDDPDARVVATCRDRAGLTASRAFPLRYDATPPDTSGASVTTGDRVVRLSWPAVAPAATLTRSPGPGGSAAATVYEGPGGSFADRRVRNGRRYRYVLTLTDDAGNAASRELAATPDRALLAPARRATVTAPPLLRWTAVRGARYYNVQLLRGDRKVLSAWPRRAQLQLEATWRYRDRERRLAPGRYRWFVWPGKGRRRANEYGPQIGARSFVVPG